ncbi:hypothetical protein MKW92_029002, partial [Papaver armeniacum]
MLSYNFTVSPMHGDMPQKERDAIMKEFTSGDRCRWSPFMTLQTSLNFTFIGWVGLVVLGA